MTEVCQVGTLGAMQKACIAGGDNHILNPVICYLEGLGRSQKFIFLHKMLFATTHTHTHHIREQRKRFDLQVIKSTRLVSHEFVISISDCILMTWFFTYLFSENGCLKWAGNPDSPPISYDLRPNTGYLYAAFFFFFFQFESLSLEDLLYRVVNRKWINCMST